MQPWVSPGSLAYSLEAELTQVWPCAKARPFGRGTPARIFCPVTVTPAQNWQCGACRLQGLRQGWGNQLPLCRRVNFSLM